MVGQIFISYAIKDKDIADTVCKFLEDLGWKCWIAPRDVLPGSDWGEAIIDAISQSRLMILIHSENANRSIQIKHEVERAGIKGVPIIPYRIEDAPVSKFLEYHLSTAYWIDAVSPPLEPHLQHLSEVISNVAGAPQTNGVAMLPGQCKACGAAMRSGESRCAACGHVREVPALAKEVLHGADKHRRPRRHWSFRLRSRAAKISVVAACVAVLSLGLYFGLRRWYGPEQGSVEAHLNQANAYTYNQQYDQAIDELTKAITEAPSNPLAYRARGDAYYRRGMMRTLYDDFVRAEADLSTAVKLNARDDYAHFMLGLVHQRLGSLDRALEDLNAAINIDPHNSDSLKQRGYVLSRLKKYDLAINDFTEAEQISPKDTNMLVSRGYAYMEEGNYDAAIRDFQDAISVAPSNPYAYQGMSAANRKLGNVDKALEYDQKAVTLLSSAPSGVRP